MCRDVINRGKAHEVAEGMGNKDRDEVPCAKEEKGGVTSKHRRVCQLEQDLLESIHEGPPIMPVVLQNVVHVCQTKVQRCEEDTEREREARENQDWAHASTENVLFAQGCPNVVSDIDQQSHILEAFMQIMALHVSPL